MTSIMSKSHLVFPHRLGVRRMILPAAGIPRQLGELDRLERRFTENAGTKDSEKKAKSATAFNMSPRKGCVSS